MLVKKPDGSVVQRMSRQLDLQGSLANLDTTRKKDFSFYRRVSLPPAEYVLEAVVRDRNADKISARKVRLHAAPDDRRSMRVSQVILCKESVLSAGSEANEAPFNLPDPLQIDGASLLPDISGVFRASVDKEIVVYLALDAVEPSSQIRATLEFLGEGAAPTSVQRKLPTPDAAGRIRYVTQIPLDSIKPGKYELRVTAMGINGPASRSVQFRLER